MKCNIKILHTSERVTRNGKPYIKVLCLIVINGNEFIQEFVVFE